MPATLQALMKTAALAVALAVSCAVAPAMAAGDEPTPPADPVVCKKPLVQNAQKTACVPCPSGTKYNNATRMCKVVNASLLNDRQLYELGRSQALTGFYQDALDTFAAIHDKHDAMVLTMIGYSKRKLGFTNEGIAIYQQALAIEPDNLFTHEYLGEGYLAAGRVDLAELELDKLEALCGAACAQYLDLQKALIGDGIWR